jgi:hypothetical protein
MLLQPSFNDLIRFRASASDENSVSVRHSR